MKNNNNIEDIFKNAFENDRVEPSAQAWSKINKKLFVQNVSNIFKGFKVNPSQAVWSSLSKKLFWLNFLRFNLKTFNVYYAGAIVILSVLTYNLIDITDTNKNILSENNSPKTELINNSIENNKPTQEELINNEITNSKNRRQALVNKNNSNSINDKNTFVESTKTNNDEFTSNNSSELNNIIEENPINKVEKNKTIVDNKIENNIEKPIISNSKEAKDVLTQNTEIEENLNKQTSSITKDEKSINKVKVITNQESQNNLEELNSNKAKNYLKSNNQISENIKIEQNINASKSINKANSEDYTPKYLNKKLPFIATLPSDSLEFIINPDTIAIDANENPIIIDKSNLYIDIIASGVRNDFSFTNFKTDLDYGKTIQNATSADYSYSAGARIGYRHKSWLAETGVSFTKFNEKFNYNYLSNQIDTSYYYNVFDSGYTKYDTIMFINLDDLLATGDTVYSSYVRETWVENTDSTLESKLDTNKIADDLNIRNIYTYVEIPLIIGYQVSKYKFTYSLNGGIITGIFMKSKGKSVSQNNTNDIIDISNLPFIKFNYSFIVTAGINYKINNNLFLLVEPYYRQSINSMFDKNYLYSKKNKAYGATVGLRYIIK